MKKYIMMCMIVLLVLTGCGKEEEVSGEKTTLVLASFDEDEELSRQIALFNQSHSDYQIEFRQYIRSEQAQEDGIIRLQREIISGEGPDIINFGVDYSITDIMGEYTEDLFPYLEKTQEDGATYFTNILDAFAYQDGLYALPVSFSLNTYAGRRSVIGDGESWTMEELIACYREAYGKSGGSLMLYPGETKMDVFGSIIKCNVGNFVDWEEGTSDFAGDDFKKLLEFADRFPDALRITEDFSPMQSFADGEALLYPLSLNSVYDICKTEMIMGEDVTYIGYPTKEADGTVIEPGALMLAISTGSKHKDAAWEFISQFMEPEYQENLSAGYPICKDALEKQLTAALTTEYTEDAEGSQVPIAKSQILFEGEDAIEIYHLTEVQKDTLMRLIENASVSSAYDSTMHSILLEEVGGYFSGQKTLDETAEVIQGRLLMYIGERL